MKYLLWGTVLLVAGAKQSAATVASIPSYYDQLQFNLTSPTAYSSAVGGYANPAVYGTMPGGETQFSWSDRENDFGKMGDWGLFLGGPNIGFGLIRDRDPLGAPPGDEVTDWRFALAGDHAGSAFGMGFGWTSGDKSSAGRSTLIQVGIVQRATRWASVGLSGDFALNNRYQKGLVDLAVRPLGDERLVVFGDYELAKNVKASDAPWSVGAMTDFYGLQVSGRYFEDDRYAFSVGFAFGGGAKLTMQPRYNKDNKTTNTTYDVRMGFHERSILEDWARKDKAYLSLNLHGRVKYRKFRYFDERSHTLSQLVLDLDKAKRDDGVVGVAISLSGATISRGMAWELREKLSDIRAAGKHVVIFTDEFNMTTMHLASVADRVVFDPEGIILIPGYALSRTYVKDLLAKIGVGFDEWRFLKYKSAAEAFSRTSMSEADREQRYGLIEDFYATVRQDVSTGRNVSAATFDDWVNERTLIDAKGALDLGLVDKLGRWEDVKDVIKELESGKSKRQVGRGWLRENRIPSKQWGDPPKVAIVYALGICAMDSGIHARKLEKIFQGLRDDGSVKAVVFRVDSPGGQALASDVAAVAMKKCAEKKPVIISQGDVAASGGYWLSMYGDKIYAQPGTIVGSIGVIGGWIWNDGIGEKLGHTSDRVTIGEHADLFTGIRLLLGGPQLPDRPLTEQEREQTLDLMKTFYESFVERAAKARKMPSEEMHALAEGRVFSGVDGKEVGLVDEIGGLDAAITAARDAAGLDPDDYVEIIEYPTMPPFSLAFRDGPFRFGSLARFFGGEDPEPEPDPLHSAELDYLRMITANPGRPLYLLPPELNVAE